MSGVLGRIRRLVAILGLGLAAAALGSCGDAHDWKTSDIAGKLPDLEFRLTDEDAREVTEADYAGAVKLVFFGYTHCPDVCPTTLSRLRAVLQALPGSNALGVKVLFISVDPRRDPPERLEEYTDAFGARFIGLTGDIPELRDMAERYGASFSYGEADADGRYPVNHPGYVYVFDADGEARLLFRQDDSVEAMADDLGALIP